MRRITFALLLMSIPFGGAFAQEAGEPSAPAGPPMSGRITPIAFPTDTVDAEYARRAGMQAAEEWVREFLSREFDARRYAVLPLDRDIDDGYFTLQVRNAFAGMAHGTEYGLFTRQDAEWNALLDEIRRGDQFGDTMEPSTVQKFGRFQGVDGVIMGRVSGIFTVSEGRGSTIQLAGDNQAIQVRLSLQAFEVETGRLLWGAERTGTAMLPVDPIMLPGTRRDWFMYGAGGILGLIFLVWIFGRLKAANRPR